MFCSCGNGLYGIISVQTQLCTFSGSHFRFAEGLSRFGQGLRQKILPSSPTYSKCKGMFVRWQVFIGIGPRKAQAAKAFKSMVIGRLWNQQYFSPKALFNNLDEGDPEQLSILPEEADWMNVICPSGKFFRCGKTLQVPSQLDKWLLCRAGLALAKGFICDRWILSSQSQFLSLFGLCSCILALEPFTKIHTNAKLSPYLLFHHAFFQQNLLMVFCHTYQINRIANEQTKLNIMV